MKILFADASYWVALVNPRDSLHQKASSLSRMLVSARVVTSEMVLTEVLNNFAEMGEYLRKAAVNMVERLRKDPAVSIVPQSSLQFQDAFALYRARIDKGWSHSDCASFQVMNRAGITEALTHDRHFEQAGFRALLRD